MRTAGILSAILLCLAAAFTGAYGPQATTASLASSLKLISGGVGAADQQSAPVSHKHSFVLVASKRDNASVLNHGGGSDAALPASEIRLPEPGFAGQQHGASAQPLERCCVFLGYSARAPPPHASI